MREGRLHRFLAKRSQKSPIALTEIHNPFHLSAGACYLSAGEDDGLMIEDLLVRDYPLLVKLSQKNL